MKKLAIVLMVLVMSLMLIGSAAAEQKLFAMTTVADAEGNVLATVTEDGNVVDAEGNDISEDFPVLVLFMDDETMTCTFGTEDEVVEGAMEVVEQTEEGVALVVTFEDDTTIQLVYSVVGINAVTYVDEESGLYFIMPEIEIPAE